MKNKNKKLEGMKVLYDAIVEEAKKNGFVFLMMLFMVVFFWNDRQEERQARESERIASDKKIELLNEKFEKYHTEDRREMIKVIQENTKAFELFQQMMSKKN